MVYLSVIVYLVCLGASFILDSRLAVCFGRNRRFGFLFVVF